MQKKTITRWTILLLTATFLLCIQRSNGQTTTTDIEKLDSSLIGEKLSFAINILHLDSNYRIITEPPGILRGIWTLENDTCNVQLIVERTIFLPKQNPSYADRYKEIKNKNIIGISWAKKNKCRNIGQVIPQFAYGQFNGCK